MRIDTNFYTMIASKWLLDKSPTWTFRLRYLQRMLLNLPDFETWRPTFVNVLLTYGSQMPHEAHTAIASNHQCEDNPALPELTDTHATTVAIVHRANWIHVSATPRTGHQTHSKYARQRQSKQKNVKPQNFLSYFFVFHGYFYPRAHKITFNPSLK
jgi:hypothetical protein